MPKLSLRRQKQLAKIRERRAARELRRDDMLEDVAGGIDYAIIARKQKISLKTVRREVARALDKRASEPPHRYVRLQVERLHRAVDDALLEGDLRGVDSLIKLLDKLDRYHGLAQTPTPTPSVEPRAAAPRLPPPAATLVIAREWTEIRT